jgi:hypothetical protein
MLVFVFNKRKIIDFYLIRVLKQLFNYKNQIYLAYTQTQILIFVVKFMKNERK